MTAEAKQADIALAIRHVSKAFGATQALRDASFLVRRATVHGLLGENGSGKSTLVKILSGYHVPDSGVIEVWDREVQPPLRPGSYREIGMGFVHQSLGLAGALSVTENLRIAEVTRPGRMRIRWRRERAAARELLESYGLAIEPTRPASSLTRSQQAMLAIVRAVEDVKTNDGRVERGLLVLDEPTSSFTIPEKEWLYRTVRRLTGGGGAVLFISHDIDEVFEITDEVTVLRDGRVQATISTDRVSGSQLAELIVGRKVVLDSHASRITPAPNPGPATPGRESHVARIRGVRGGLLAGADIEVSRGEVLGLTGLAGSGFEEILPLAFGVAPADAGRLEVGGQDYSLAEMTPARALRLGIGMVPGDRDRSGCVLDLSITDNVTLLSLDRHATPIGLRRRSMSSAASRAIARHGIRASGASAAVGTLSGGNQQKVLIAKWLAVQPKLLLLQEPTVGLDIGARLDIFQLIHELAAGGTAIVCASSDWEQLAEISTRVVIFANGRIASSLSGDGVTESSIGHECYRVSTQSRALASAAVAPNPEEAHAISE